MSTDIPVLFNFPISRLLKKLAKRKERSSKTPSDVDSDLDGLSELSDLSSSEGDEPSIVKVLPPANKSSDR